MSYQKIIIVGNLGRDPSALSVARPASAQDIKWAYGYYRDLPHV